MGDLVVWRWRWLWVVANARRQGVHVVAVEIYNSAALAWRLERTVAALDRVFARCVGINATPG